MSDVRHSNFVLGVSLTLRDRVSEKEGNNQSKNDGGKEEHRILHENSENFEVMKCIREFFHTDALSGSRQRRSN